MSDKLSDCAECGMPCASGEYHPHAACLMFKGCHDSTTVRAGLAAIREHALSASPAPAISESDDAARLDWLTDRLEDAVIDGADPAKYLPDDVGDGNQEGAAACRRAWRLAIDAARKGEKS
ncbi:hypothetical protein [Burkholderia sp. ISTR5]|uniref:hypothetical protein n=1 Tax=Burkholderia sp. ISTR5 TaxID=2500161 RepID=UPI00136F1494|nr:hypothetical protein [Burkholderia sp. ISTR5]NBI44939.1 hypothetical protein [Burkholderia sp. ISTR5]